MPTNTLIESSKYMEGVFIYHQMLQLNRQEYNIWTEPEIKKNIFYFVFVD